MIPRGIDGGPATLPRVDDAAPAANALAENAAFRDLVGSGLPQAPDRSHEPAAPALRQQAPRAPDARPARSPSDPDRGPRRSSPLRPLPRSGGAGPALAGQLEDAIHTEAMWRSAFASYEATASSSATSQPRHMRHGRSRDDSVPRRPATGGCNAAGASEEAGMRTCSQGRVGRCVVGPARAGEAETYDARARAR